MGPFVARDSSGLFFSFNRVVITCSWTFVGKVFTKPATFSAASDKANLCEIPPGFSKDKNSFNLVFLSSCNIHNLLHRTMQSVGFSNFYRRSAIASSNHSFFLTFVPGSETYVAVAWDIRPCFFFAQPNL